ncbi:hypothetical protein [Methanoculleus sp.]|uniref:hypothetical protein n=1 Tax=Methanoculleus sp. TaxID=90427 RepID=UPI0025E6B600|nr:hypothetical protein [Methanoculleus sp.]MCK9319891.1 hypothetical protein [Methanoculleus sp.]
MNQEQFVNDMLIRHGINCEKKLSVYHFIGKDSGDNVAVFYYRVKDIVVNKICEYNPNFDIDTANIYEIKKIHDAMVEQGAYMLMTGIDASMITGLDFTGNTVMDHKSIKQRAFNDNAHRILMNAGLLYRGLRPRNGYQDVI